MNPTSMAELEASLQDGDVRGGLPCAAPLEVASRLVSAAVGHRMTATTVVGVLGYDDVDAFRALVAELSQQYGVEAAVRIKPGSYVVRFNRSPARSRRP